MTADLEAIVDAAARAIDEVFGEEEAEYTDERAARAALAAAIPGIAEILAEAVYAEGFGPDHGVVVAAGAKLVEQLRRG